MTWLFAMFYLVPAAASALAFWAIWRLVRLLDLTLLARRAIFVLLGTLLLSPVIVPAGTIMTAGVPHSLLLLTPDLEYYVRFARFVFPSFAITALAFTAIAWWRIKADVQPLPFNWTTLTVPIVVTVLIIGMFDYFVPDREISRKITTPVLDAVYGQHLNDVVALLGIDDPAQQTSEVRRLKSEFSKDRAVVRVSLEDPNTEGSVHGQLFYYLRAESPPSVSCSGVNVGDQAGLTRCTWSFGRFDELDVLEYVRYFEHGDETLQIEIEFDYDELLDAVDR